MRVFVVMMEVIVFDFFLDMNRYGLLLDDFFNDFLFFYNNRFMMMMNVLHLCVRVFVMRFPHGHMNHNLFLMIAANDDENKIGKISILLIEQ